jgi:DNA transformation protein
MKSQRERKKRSPGSLAVSTSYRRFVLDQFEELGEVTPRDMFGGVGLYWRDVFFGIIARDVLYLKVDDSSRSEYVRCGMRPFQPYPNRTGTMQYYEVPLSVIESPTELARWARKAIQLGS